MKTKLGIFLISILSKYISENSLLTENIIYLELI